MVRIYILIVGAIFRIFLNYKNIWWLLVKLLRFMLIIVIIKFSLFFDYKIIGASMFLDYTRVILSLLSLIVTLLIIVARVTILRNKIDVAIFILMCLFLCYTLMLRFTLGNYLLFYLFFESSLIPTVFLIIGWGYQVERIQAGVYFIFYTLISSLPFLFILLIFYKIFGSLSIFNFLNLLIIDVSKFIIYTFSMVIILAFCVKLPVYLVHLWLGKAHVEAPVSGSMILAGVLLKLGGYGIYRMLLKFNIFILKLSNFFLRLRIIGIITVGYLCCRLRDIKLLIAYSSVSHIGITIIGLLSFFCYGLTGRIIIIVSHGLVSSGLFLIINFLYERTGSRSLYLNKGLTNFIPSIALFVFLLIVANVAAPPSINLLAEILLIIRVVTLNLIFYCLLPLRIFLTIVFCIFIYSYTQHNKVYKIQLGFFNSFIREIHCFLIHVLPVYLIIGFSLIISIYLNSLKKI